MRRGNRWGQGGGQLQGQGGGGGRSEVDTVIQVERLMVQLLARMDRMMEVLMRIVGLSNIISGGGKSSPSYRGAQCLSL
jgi:hypothetical protein